MFIIYRASVNCCLFPCLLILQNVPLSLFWRNCPEKILQWLITNPPPPWNLTLKRFLNVLNNLYYLFFFGGGVPCRLHCKIPLDPLDFSPAYFFFNRLDRGNELKDKLVLFGLWRCLIIGIYINWGKCFVTPSIVRMEHWLIHCTCKC